MSGWAAGSGAQGVPVAEPTSSHGVAWERVGCGAEGNFRGNSGSSYQRGDLDRSFDPLGGAGWQDAAEERGVPTGPALTAMVFVSFLCFWIGTKFW